MITEKGYILRHLQWDTKFFVFKCARVYLKSELTNEQYEALQKEVEDYVFITIDNEVGAYKNNKLLCRLSNCFLVDVPLTYRLNVGCCINNAGSMLITNNAVYNAELLQIGLTAFKHGRFYKDNYITEENASQIYVSWLNNAFYRADKYFLLEEKLNGFILFSETYDKKGLDIELIAVAETARRRGVAKKMLSALSNYAAKKRYNYITVITQADNIAAINLYSGQGYKLDKCMYTYHYWRR